MILVAIIVDPNDNKVKTEWFYLKKNRPWHSLRKLVLVYNSLI